MYQLLKFDKPIPSCYIHQLEFSKEENKWYFIYAVKTPFELTNDNAEFQEELIIYEYISDLILQQKKEVHSESINITIKTLDEYLYYLNKQREEDIKYRKQWLAENPESKPNTFILENRDYDYSELKSLNIHLIADTINICDQMTIFAGI